MKLDNILSRMQSFPEGLRILVGDLDSEDARWRPTDGAWSILEIVNHLADEEHEDFRHRLCSTLENPERPWPPIDPEGVVKERGFNDRDMTQSLDRFAKERQETVQWLRDLESPDWDATYPHPLLGDLRAGDLMASLAVHDSLHLRQICRRLFELTTRDTQPWSASYAGTWPDVK